MNGGTRRISVSPVRIRITTSRVLVYGEDPTDTRLWFLTRKKGTDMVSLSRTQSPVTVWCPEPSPGFTTDANNPTTKKSILTFLSIVTSLETSLSNTVSNGLRNTVVTKTFKIVYPSILKLFLEGSVVPWSLVSRWVSLFSVIVDRFSTLVETVRSGRGQWSSPVVVGNEPFVTTHESRDETRRT